uniref:FAD/NAD(P)-binding domain-containing protein n=1 Tax=Hemiselmis andersenii TaxID=464988 RepID=A0A7S1E9J2_HEMAN
MRAPRCCGKVKISGGGRCNVMHDDTKPVKLISEGYPRGQKQLLGPFARFGPTQTAEWFKAEGVELKTEQDGRMFPVTDSSQTVIDALMGAADTAGVQIRTRCKVEGIDHSVSPEGRRFSVRTVEREADRKGVIECDYLLLATGSARLSYAWAKGLGHDLEAPVPSLFTFTISDTLLQGLAGVSVQDAIVSIPSGKPKKPLTQQGPVLVTHSGVSGPAILRLSAFGARVLHETDYKTTLKINWTPEIERGIEGVVEQVLEAKAKDSAKTVGGASSPTFGLPRRLWQAMVAKVGLKSDAKWGEVKNSDLRKVAALMCQCQLEVQGKGTFKDEFVTAGGVSLKGVDMKRLESKSVEGLYFAGEVLDIDGITGGYNFQSAWTTGWTAGRSVAEQALSEGDSE